MKKKLLAILLLLLLCSMIIYSFLGDTQNSIFVSNDESSEPYKPTGLSDASSADLEIYNQLFNLNNFISVKVDISDEEIAKIQADYTAYSPVSKSPIYRRADKVTITIGQKTYEIEDVGVRMKGNTSRTDFYSEDKGIYNIINLKLSFNETFDDKDYYENDAEVWENDEKRKERKNRTFATLEGLDLKYNASYDTTHLCEYYSFALCRDAGVLGAQLNPSVLSVNNKNWGVFTLYEPVDEIFLERNLPKQDWGGDLYKAAWTNSPATYTDQATYGVNDEEGGISYNYDLKTNKKRSKQKSMAKLIKVLNSRNASKEDFDSVVATDYWLKFSSAGYFTGAPDDMRNNYNNHFVYFLKSNGKAIFIPYDYDISFGAVSKWDPTNTAMTSVSPYSERADGLNTRQYNPLYNLSLKYYSNEYTDMLQKVSTSKFMKFETFEEKYKIVSTLYKDYLIPDIDFENVDKSKLKFSLESDYSKDGNMAVSEYMNKILKTYEKSAEEYNNNN